MSIERIEAPFLCPECGGESVVQERCPDGIGWCAQGHAFRQSAKLTKKLMPDGRMHTIKVEHYIERVPRRDTNA